MVVHVAKADLARIPVDAIVLPTTSACRMVRGISLHIKENGGEAAEREAQEYAPLAIGAAVVTGPGKLGCKHVIHVPILEDPEEIRVGIENTRRAIRAGLIAAQASGFDIVAIPGMSLDAIGLLYEEVARAILDELKTHKGSAPSTVYIIDNSDVMIRAFEEAHYQIQHPPSA